MKIAPCAELIDDGDPSPNQQKKDTQHTSSYIHVPTSWRRLYARTMLKIGR